MRLLCRVGMADVVLCMVASVMLVDAPAAFAGEGAAQDVSKLLASLRDESGVDIAFTSSDSAAGSSVPLSREKQSAALKWLENVMLPYPFGTLPRVADRISLVGGVKTGKTDVPGILSGRELILALGRGKPGERDTLFHALVFQAAVARLESEARGEPPDGDARILMDALVGLPSFTPSRADNRKVLSAPEMAAGLLTADRDTLQRCRKDAQVLSVADTCRQVYRRISQGAMDDLFWRQLLKGESAIFAALPRLAAGGGEESPAPPSAQGGPRSETTPAVAPVSGDPSGPVPTLENFRTVDVPVEESAAAPSVAGTEPRPEPPNRPVKTGAASDATAAPVGPTAGATESPVVAYKAGVAEFAAGRYRTASDLWTAMIQGQPDAYATIHLGVSCSLTEAKRIQGALEPAYTFFAIRVMAAGRECFILYSGLYRDSERLKRDLSGIRVKVGTEAVLKPVKLREAKLAASK